MFAASDPFSTEPTIGARSSVRCFLISHRSVRIEHPRCLRRLSHGHSVQGERLSCTGQLSRSDAFDDVNDQPSMFTKHLNSTLEGEQQSFGISGVGAQLPDPLNARTHLRDTAFGGCDVFIRSPQLVKFECKVWHG